MISRTKTRDTVHEFIDHLNSTITPPIDNVLLASHANAQGYLFVPMFDGQRGPTNYETLEDTISDAARSIAVSDSLIGYNTGDPITHSFHFKGCNIGKAAPFLRKMKEAIGGNMFVTAPIHFHGLYWNSAYGVWELMCYEFRILRKTPFATKNDLITAFDTAGFTFYNGSAIATADWESWVPRRIDRSSKSKVSLNLGVTMGERSTITFDNEFRYLRDDYTFTIGFPSPSNVPTSLTDRMNALDQGLDNFKYRESDTIGGFDAAHPFPEYERWGYTSKQDFINEHDWRFSQSGNMLICKGRFFDYTVSIPITDRVTGNVIFNFHPNSGSPHAAVQNLIETDSQFFATAS